MEQEKPQLTKIVGTQAGSKTGNRKSSPCFFRKQLFDPVKFKVT